MSWAIVAVAGAGLVTGAMSADAAGDAADTQAEAGDRATAAQERMFERQVELQQPWLDAGEQGLNKLSVMMGLKQPTQPNMLAGQKLVEMRNGVPVANADLYANHAGYRDLWDRSLADHVSHFGGGYTTGSDAGKLEQGMRDALGAQLAAEQANPAAPDTEFGSLMKTFGASDFEADPGYAFRKEEQERALQRATAARGGLGSGKFLKDAMKFSGGLASQEFGAARGRFNDDRDSGFNKLATISGIGQVATNRTADAAGAFGQQMGSNIIGAGNALAAGRVGSANAWSSAIGQGASMYQQQNMLNRYAPPYYDTGAGMSPPNPYYGG